MDVMKRRKEIIDELERMGSPLASMPSEMPYSVPENYFSSLSEDIYDNIQFVLSPDPSLPVHKTMPYEVPAGYFDTLPTQMLAYAKEHSDALKTTPYLIPQGYFNALPAQILQAAKASGPIKKTKLIPLYARSWAYARWAAAALLVATIGFGSFKYFVHQNSNPEIALAKIPENVLRDYAQQNFDDFDIYMNVNNIETNNADKYTKQLSPQDIEQYFEESGLGQKNID